MSTRTTNPKSEDGFHPKKNYNRKGSQRPYKEKRDSDRPYRPGDENDITWYMKDEALVKQAGKIAFVNALGNRLPRAEYDGTHADDMGTLLPIELTDSEELGYAVPGIFRIAISPSLGVSTDSQSPLNVAARAMFSFIQSTLNMRMAPSIEAPDLMCYMGSVDSIASFYAWVARLYGTICEESALNKYVGRALCTANGVNYQDLRDHLPDMKFFLDYMRRKVNGALYLPKGFGFAKRHFWLFSNYFKDSPVEKSQIYTYTPVGFYMWNPTKYETGTCLDFESLASHCSNVNSITWTEIQEYGNMLLNAMLEDQDANSIGGFILRGWGSEGCTSLPEVPNDYAVQPVYSEEILGQIHNGQCVGVRVSPAIISDNSVQVLLDYYQKQEGDSWLYCKPGFRVNADDNGEWNDSNHIAGIMNVAGLSLVHLMDSFVDAPTDQEVIINSRNMMSGHLEVTEDKGHVGSKIAWIDSCGLDIIWFYQAFMFNENKAVLATEYATAMVENAGDEYGMTPIQGTSAAVLSKFDWAPRIVYGSVIDLDSDEGPTGLRLSADVWDYNNVTSVSNEALDKMHLAALNGAFDLGVRVNGMQQIAK